MSRSEQEDVPPEIAGHGFVEKIASGGFSHVYLYRQQTPERLVAVKVLKGAGLTDAAREQFLHEANVMARLDHPHIVPVYAADIAPDGRPYLVMKYYTNRNLAERSAQRPFSVAETIRIGIQVGSAVETAHRAMILHRDIKPANILMSSYGPGLADFGIAGQIVSADEDDDPGVSPPWAAPEVLYGTSPASVSSDVYSLGASLWNLLVGRSPFAVSGDNSSYALMQRIAHAPVPPTGRDDVPGSLQRLLAKSMSKAAIARPTTALNFCYDLQVIEQELGLDRTEIPAIFELTAQHEPAGPQDSPDATRVRAPIVRDSQQTLDRRPKAKAPQREALPNWPVPRQQPPADLQETHRPAQRSVSDQRRLPVELLPTRRPPVKPSVPDVETAAPAGPRLSARRALMALVVVAVGAVAVGAVLLGRAPHDTAVQSPKAGSTVGSGQDAASAGDALPPGEPTVTAVRRDANTVRFSWSYSARLAGDSYLWQSQDGVQHPKVTVPHVDVPLVGKAKLCVQVKVFRADGSNPPASWSAKGCYPR